MISGLDLAPSKGNDVLNQTLMEENIKFSKEIDDLKAEIAVKNTAITKLENKLSRVLDGDMNDWDNAQKLRDELVIKNLLIEKYERELNII